MGYNHVLLLTLISALNLLHTVNSEIYIVHVELPATEVLSSAVEDLDAWYQTFLPNTLSTSGDNGEDSDSDPIIIYSYHNVFKGFAARLTPEQVDAMKKIPGFVSARRQRTLSLHTTHSPNFLGLNQNTGFWSDSNYGRGVIIGVLDTGVNPYHPSFADEGMPPPPARWRGVCQFASAPCNNKLIGARAFTIGDGTPLDDSGHGTHVSSTAAGTFVSGANVFGSANGTAAGIAPMAHIASYKVCSDRACSESDILAAMDVAIDDGVDILSLSLGGPARVFYAESVAIGAFRAVERGIFVSASAGNAGPSLESVQNGAPWILTVGASTIDRRIRATAVLGNGEELNGESIYQPANFPATRLPLFYGGSASARFCIPSALSNLQGRIVLCEEGGGIGRVAKGQAVRNAGGAAMILINQQGQGYTTNAESHVLPATHLSYADGVRVRAYFYSTPFPVAGISFKGTIIGDQSAPMVPWYSSRGPNIPSPGILKPDIIGPGHNILAGWHRSVENNPSTISNFNIISGTSMACPHLSGVAALLKNAHPDWSPAAIKSAIMTTADQVNLAGNLIQDQTLNIATFLATGSGHVNVLRAANPGLVYDIQPDDYLPYLCGLGYTNQQVGIIANRPVNCASISSIPEAALNYPSFILYLGNTPQTYRRTVTNVGAANAVYTVQVSPFTHVQTTVVPNRLQFSAVNQRLTYQVTFTRIASGYFQGELVWASGSLSVTSPVIVDTRSALADTRSALADTSPVIVDTRSALADTRSALADTRSALADTSPVVVDTRSALVDTRSALVLPQ